MESLLGKADEYSYEDVIINPYLAGVKAAIGKLCFFGDLARRLTTPEFIEFCKDKGLSVKFLREEKIYN